MPWISTLFTAAAVHGQGERQRAVQRPARRFENQFLIPPQGLKVFRAK
jgi:hypothetical protein